jgi:FkbM family methyltransferase
MRKIKHFLFTSIIQIWKISPFKLTLSKLIKHNSKIKEKLYQDLRFEGNMDIKVGESNLILFNPGFTTIENELFWNGLEEGWEKVSMDIWKKLSKDANCILDIGANTGVYSLVAASINPDAEIFAFEPVQRTASIFKTNLELNPALNIELFEVAVSNNSGTATFYDLPTNSQYSASLNKDMLATYSERISYDVTIVKLDDLEELKNKKIDLIKLDVEMHEPEAIEGMIEIIKSNEPTFLIEILTPEIGVKVGLLLRSIDYCCFSIDENNPPKYLTKITNSDFHNLLLIKKEKLNLLNLLIQE